MQEIQFYFQEFNQYMNIVYIILGVVLGVLLLFLLMQLVKFFKAIKNSTQSLSGIAQQVVTAKNSVVETKENIEREKMKINKIKSNLQTASIIKNTILKFSKKT